MNNTDDGLNRDAGIAALSGGYDPNGDVTNDGTRTFTYDHENRLLTVGITSTSTTASLAYDPSGRLQTYDVTVGSTTTNTLFLYEGSRLVAEYDAGSGNLLRRYVHGPGVDEPIVWYEGSGTSDRRWLHKDEHGSVIAVSNASGGENQTQTYGPWGEPGAWSGSRFSYTGQIMLAEVQLYFYKARVYDPNFGRFLQTDPIGYDGGQNLYVYVTDDPIDLGDPAGFSGQPAGAVAAGTSKALDVAEDFQDGMVNTTSVLLGLSGQPGGPKLAMDFGTYMKSIGYGLTIGSQAAAAVSDIQNGVPPDQAVVTHASIATGTIAGSEAGSTVGATVGTRIGTYVGGVLASTTTGAEVGAETGAAGGTAAEPGGGTAVGAVVGGIVGGGLGALGGAVVGPAYTFVKKQFQNAVSEFQLLTTTPGLLSALLGQ